MGKEVAHARKTKELVHQESEGLGRTQEEKVASDRESSPISPAPVRTWRDEYIPAYLSNGLIGLRVGSIPLIEGLAIVNGLAAIDPVEQGEAFSRGPYPIGGDLEVNGERLSRLPHRARFIEQRYDFSCGELHSRFEFRSGQVTATADVLTLCSRSLPSVVLQEIQLTVDRACRVTLTAKVDPTGINGVWRQRETRTPASDTPTVDGSLLWEPPGGLSTCGAAYTTQFEGAEGVECRREEHDQLAPLSTAYSWAASPGRRYLLRQMTSLLPSQLHSEPNRQAARMAAMARQRGFQKLRDENRSVWQEIWKGRIRLVGADRRWQAMADAAYYYLHASAHSSSLCSTSMFGLAFWPNYHYYLGHVMWDIETFVFPTLLLTAPEAAHALLAYRFQRLQAAQRNAAMYGYRGLQFPWASGPRDGQEAIRLSAPQIVFEQHVSLSVALAFARYVHATGDEDYAREKAWPVLEGVANWIESRVVPTDRGYELKEVIGVAEQTTPVDNNAYVNMEAIVVLREAAALARRLNRRDADRWEPIADKLFLPIDKGTGVIRNHDRFTGQESGAAAATPEALAGFFPVDYPVDSHVESATTEFSLARVQDYIGSPMLSPLLGVYAARLRDRSRSLRLFEEGYAEFVQEPYGEPNEFSRTRFPDKPRVGPFMANLGGFLMSCLYGLTGLHLSSEEPTRWFTRPVVLPEGWESIEVDQLFVRGRSARLRARHGDERAQLIFES